jgi:hypothetical protein
MRLPYLVTCAFAASVAILSPLACGGSSASSQPSPDAGGGDSTGSPETSTGTQDSAAVDSPADTPPDAVDNGAPSTNYPGPHPALPQLVNNANGKVLTSPKVYLVFYSGYTPATVTALQDFAQKMVTSTFWSTTTQEYGVGALAYGGTITLPVSETPPTNISSTDIQTWVAAEIQAGTFGTPDPQAIYTIVYPESTTITQPNPVSTLLMSPTSCVDFGGYHDNTTASVTDGGATTSYAYAVIPTCMGSSADDLTSVISHEWVEASTDPFLTSGGTFTLSGGPNAAFYSVDKDHLVWDLLGGGEAGDLCEPESPAVYITPADIGHMVQRTWSNLQAQGSHDPCAPDIAGAFFDAAPVLTETVTFSSTITGTITSKGVTIPVGQSKTIEVDLFSDGDPGGPWTVTAEDVLYKYYGSYGIPKSLSFAWDRTQGLNGEKLHLTVTVTSASIIAGAHAFMITSSNGSRQAVWPGLVVEQ